MNRTQHALAKGLGGMPPRKIFKLCTPEIETRSTFDGNYEAIAKAYSGQLDT